MAEACPCCEAGSPGRYGQVYRRCVGCGHIWFADLATADLAGLYENHYFNGEEYLDYGLEAEALRKNFRSRLAELTRLRGTGGRLLDVGCAYGYFVAEAGGYLGAEGCDVSDHALANARMQCDRPFHRGHYDTLDLGRFDVITLWDVIEHLAHPADYVAKAARDLNEGGWLALSTGDAGALWPRLRGTRWRQFHPPTHLHYFTVRSVTSLLARYGLEVREVKHPVFWRSLRAAAYRVLAHGRAGPRRWLYGALEKSSLLNHTFPWQSGDLMVIYAQKRSIRAKSKH